MQQVMHMANSIDGSKLTCAWDATVVPAPETDSIEPVQTVDVAIIGAGWTGLRTALELAKAGTKTAVLDKETVAFGASGRSGGQVNLGFKQDPEDLVALMGGKYGERMLNAVSRVGDEVFGLVVEHDLKCDPMQGGWLKASYTSKTRKRQESQKRQWEKYGVELTLLSGEQIRDMSGARGYKAGLVYSRGGAIQPKSYTRELARVARSFGAKIFEHSPVTEIKRANGKLELTTGKNKVIADKVVICTNGYTDGLWPGLAKTVVPIRSVQAATEPLSPELRAQILPRGNTLSDMRRIIYYFRCDRDGRLCFGGLGPFRDELRLSDFTGLIKGATKIFPALAGVKWTHHWGGRLAMTSDELPRIHELAPGIYAGLGFNGRGVGLGTIFGRNLATLVQTGDPDQIEFPVVPARKYPFYEFSGLGFPFVTKWMAVRDWLDLKTDG